MRWLAAGRRLAASAAVLALLPAVLPLPASSAGGDRYRDRGRDSPLDPVHRALDEERWQDALTLLEPLAEREPDDADVWNLTGYASRKLGRLERARTAYDRALELDPKHRRAHAYLGELHLQRGDAAAAEAQLARLDELCWLPCREERTLRRAIETWRAQQLPPQGASEP